MSESNRDIAFLFIVLVFAGGLAWALWEQWQQKQRGAVSRDTRYATVAGGVSLLAVIALKLAFKSAGRQFDFALVLTLFTLGTGVVWVIDKLALRKSRGNAAPDPFIEFCVSFFPVIALVLGLRTCLAEPFRIPSGSMIPTLNIGDFILVNKFAFGVRDPVFHYKLIPNGEPQRGDIVVFRWPVDPTKDFIKRIVGVPGDRISYRDKTLYVNDQKAAQDPDGVYTGPYGAVYRYSENLSGVQHNIIVNPDRPADDFDFIVPEGEYYAMGDNRDGSDDSRRWGTVPEKNLVGRAFFIWMSWDSAAMRIDFSRIGTRLQ